MSRFWETDTFYPTPRNLLEKIIENEGTKIHLSKFSNILEPSAGKGDIADFIKEERYGEANIDCIEINKTLQSTLMGKGYHVIADDFLAFETFFHYDLIFVNNPPLSVIA